jgi:endo-1,4-beta-xylanase
MGEYKELLTTHFNTVTAENQMKPDNLAPREKGGQYNFGPADHMVNEILEYGITVHGHTLVWHKQTPAWMTTGTPAQVRENMVNYINTVLAHYKGKVISWDVVNEGIRERINPGDQDLSWKTQLREDSGWFKALGADYIELAFRAARAADPDIELYFNDYNLDNQRKVQVTVNMIKDINDKYKAEGNTRNLIDGIGMQAHYATSTSSVNVRNSIQKFKDIGIKIAISELDIEIKSVGSGSFGTGRNSTTTEVEQRIQAITYAELFNIFKENKDHITRVTMWGMDDEFSWKSLGNPCLWDGELNPKQAFWAVVDPKKTLRL